MFNKCLFGVFSTILVLTNAKGVFDTCKDGFENMKDSTMCLTDSKNFIDGGVTAEEIHEILQEHNKYRATVNPEGSDLFKVYWDDAVAAVAQKLSQQCKLYHDRNRRVASLPGVYIGQNVAAGQLDWTHSIAAWHREVKYFEYGKGLNTTGKAIGHYTQVVSSGVLRVGCGFSKCHGGYHTYYVCNYALGQYGLNYPYSSGKKCAACPNQCSKDGLCDCGGLLCTHGGKLDKNTCKCHCNPAYAGIDCTKVLPCRGMRCYNGGIFDLANCKCTCTKKNTYGKECEFFEDETSDGQIVCKFAKKTKIPEGTAEQCLAYGKHGDDIHECKKTHASKKWGCNDCVKWRTMPTKYCPIMCGVCHPKACRGMKCYNGGKLDEQSCTCSCLENASGKNCEIVEDRSSGRLVCKFSNRVFKKATEAECKTFPSKGKDLRTCKASGGGWGCNFCTKYSNVRKDYCPQMCGICQ